jgi:ubiquitin-activating enzyme E1 C
MMYTGSESVYTYTFKHDKREACPVCGGKSILVDAEPDWTLETLLEKLEARQDM